MKLKGPLVRRDKSAVWKKCNGKHHSVEQGVDGRMLKRTLDEQTVFVNWIQLALLQTWGFVRLYE